MLPSYKRIKREFRVLMLANFEAQRDRNMPGLNQAQRVLFHEGNRSGFYRKDESFEETKTSEIKVPLTLSKETVLNGDINGVAKFFNEFAKLQAVEESKLMLSTIFKTIERTGNIVESSGQNYQEMIMALVDKSLVEFDQAGNVKSSFIMSPKLIEAIIKRDESLSPKQLQKERKEATEQLDRKYQEYLERENSRKLVI